MRQYLQQRRLSRELARHLRHRAALNAWFRTELDPPTDTHTPAWNDRRLTR